MARANFTQPGARQAWCDAFLEAATGYLLGCLRRRPCAQPCAWVAHERRAMVCACETHPGMLAWSRERELTSFPAEVRLVMCYRSDGGLLAVWPASSTREKRNSCRPCRTTKSSSWPGAHCCTLTPNGHTLAPQRIPAPSLAHPTTASSHSPAYLTTSHRSRASTPLRKHWAAPLPRAPLLLSPRGGAQIRRARHRLVPVSRVLALPEAALRQVLQGGLLCGRHLVVLCVSAHGEVRRARGDVLVVLRRLFTRGRCIARPCWPRAARGALGTQFGAPIWWRSACVRRKRAEAQDRAAQDRGATHVRALAAAATGAPAAGRRPRSG